MPDATMVATRTHRPFEPTTGPFDAVTLDAGARPGGSGAWP
jgi:hypothetical protein